MLKYLNIEKYIPLFEREDIDLQTFLTLTDTDLKAIPIDLLGTIPDFYFDKLFLVKNIRLWIECGTVD